MKQLVIKYMVNFLELFNMTEKRLDLYNLDVIEYKGHTYDLSEYLIDSQGTLYSINRSSWATKYGQVPLTLSEGSRDAQGHVVNTLRDLRGAKVTIRRDVLKAKMYIGNFKKV